MDQTIYEREISDRKNRIIRAIRVIRVIRVGERDGYPALLDKVFHSVQAAP